jgi:hypothetical protein
MAKEGEYLALLRDAVAQNYGHRFAVSSHPAARATGGAGLAAGCAIRSGGGVVLANVGLLFVPSPTVSFSLSESSGAATRKASTSFSSLVSSSSFCRKTSYTFFIA